MGQQFCRELQEDTWHLLPVHGAGDLCLSQRDHDSTPHKAASASKGREDV
jgi:hypothetical protein